METISQLRLISGELQVRTRRGRQRREPPSPWSRSATSRKPSRRRNIWPLLKWNSWPLARRWLGDRWWYILRTTCRSQRSRIWVSFCRAGIFAISQRSHIYVPKLLSFWPIGKPRERFQSYVIKVYFIPVPNDHTAAVSYGAIPSEKKFRLVPLTNLYLQSAILKTLSTWPQLRRLSVIT